MHQKALKLCSPTLKFTQQCYSHLENYSSSNPSLTKVDNFIMSFKGRSQDSREPTSRLGRGQANHTLLDTFFQVYQTWNNMGFRAMVMEEYYRRLIQHKMER
jgi:hypothetical protein